MVVPSGSWIQNVNEINQNKSMFATGILICHDNSYPFQERTLSLEKPIKIGRSVARARAGNDNAIFDCKVLSRNHALLWYEAGKFYLKDTKSSNGTFVNNKRLSPSGEESSACELNSGDVVQFGVDVVESTKKVTHGCIVAILKLYLPDGKEAKAGPTNSVAYVNVTLEDLYKLNQIIQEAGRRENALRSKLDYMQQLLDHTRTAVTQSWKALVLEDCLLSRLEMLENQVVVYSKNFGEDKLRLELLNLLEDKSQYQNIAKELLKKKVQEKREIIGKIQILKCRLGETEELTQSLHTIIKENQNELQELAIKYITAQEALQDTTDKLNKTKTKLKEVLEQSEIDKQEFLKKLESQKNNDQSLQIALNGSKFDSINIYKQISALRNHLLTLQDAKYYINQLDGTENTKLIETFNFILSKWNSMYIKILDNKILVDTNKKEEIYMIDELRLKNSFYDHESILHNQLVNLSNNDTNLCKYILPPAPKKSLSIKNDLLNLDNSENKNSDNNEDSYDITTDQELKIQTVNNDLSVPEIIENEVDGKLDDTVEILMKFSDQNVENFDIKKEETSCSLTDHNFSESKDLLKNNLLSMQIIKIAQEINRIIEENEEIVPKDKKVKTEQVYLNNVYIINTLKSSIERNLNFNECIYGFLLENLLCLSDMALKINSSDSNTIEKLENLRQWLLCEPNDVIINKLKEHYLKVENDSHQIQELSEQLIILKEKYNLIIEEKAEITHKLKSLEAEQKNSIIISYMVPVYYFAPVILMLLWLLFEKII